MSKCMMGRRKSPEDEKLGVPEMDEETLNPRLEIFETLGRQNRFLDIFENRNGARYGLM